VGFGRGRMPIDVFASGGLAGHAGHAGCVDRAGHADLVDHASQEPLARFTVGQHVVVKCHAGPAPGTAHATVTKIGEGVDVTIDEGPYRGLSLYIDALGKKDEGVLPNNNLDVLTWLLDRSSIADAPILLDLAKEGLIPKSSSDKVERIFEAVKKARLHDHTSRQPTTTDIGPSELPIIVNLVRQDLAIHPDAWIYSQGNGRFDVHIEPGLYYTFYT
jgi:hypothetical protein